MQLGPNPIRTRVWNEPLPNPASVLRNHRLPGLAAPGLLKLRHILHHAVHAILSRRMRIRQDPHPRHLRTPLLTPHSPESQEEPLLRRVAVDRLSFLPALLVSDHVLQRHHATRAPPLSAVFSPSVSRPFSFRSSTATKFEYSFATQLARFSNSSPSCFVHQSRKFPCGSNFLP